MRSLCLPASLLLLGLLAGCADLVSDGKSTSPPTRPDGLGAPEEQSAAELSARAQALARRYVRIENGLVARGLLRVDGGGIDTPFTARMLQENFERIAFFDEYQEGEGLRAAGDTPVRLRRWSSPIRVTVEHGDWANQEVQTADRAAIESYVARLRRITGHPMTLSETAPNYHVIFASLDETADLPARIQQIVPNVAPTSLRIFEDLPSEIQCLVIAFSNGRRAHTYTRAIAIIRAEHPPLMRLACIHEELAQGLGLANDSPQARPSIFNDDDEFALLTTHDEMLLRMLYDPALRPGMALEEARPIVTRLAEELVGGQSG